MRSHYGVSSVARVVTSSCMATITARYSPRSTGPMVRSRSSAYDRPRTSGKGQIAAPSTMSTRSSGMTKAEVHGFGSRCESGVTIPTRVDSALRVSGSLPLRCSCGRPADPNGSDPSVSSSIRRALRGFPKRGRDPTADRRRWRLPRMAEARRGFGNRSHGTGVRGPLRG